MGRSMSSTVIVPLTPDIQMYGAIVNAHPSFSAAVERADAARSAGSRASARSASLIDLIEDPPLIRLNSQLSARGRHYAAMGVRVNRSRRIVLGSTASPRPP